MLDAIGYSIKTISVKDKKFCLTKVKGFSYRYRQFEGFCIMKGSAVINNVSLLLGVLVVVRRGTAAPCP
jgi:hypothetical protein